MPASIFLLGQSVQNSCNMVSKSEILHINMFTSTVPVDRNECIGTCYTCSSLDACNASISQTNCRCCRPKVTENRTVKFRWFNPFSNLLYNFIIPVTKSCECSTCS